MPDPSLGRTFEKVTDDILSESHGEIESSPWLAELSDSTAVASLRVVAECLESLGYDPPHPTTEEYLDYWQSDLAALGFPEFKDSNKNLCEAELYFRRLVSLDGDYEIREMPHDGDTSLDSRVFHLRLKHFALFPYPVDAPFGMYEGPWDYAIRVPLGLGDETSVLDLANILGDVGRLWTLIRQALTTRPFIIVRGRYDGEWRVDDLATVWAEWEGRFSRIDPGGWLGGASGSTGYDASPQELQDDRINDLGAMTLQVLLWMNGYCGTHPNGTATDGDAPRLIEALRNEGHLTAADISGDVAFALRRVAENLWAVNVGAIGSIFVDLPDAQVAEETGASIDYTAVFEELLVVPREAENDPALADRLLYAFDGTDPPAIAAARSSPGIFSRIYQGARRLLVNASRAIRRGLSWVHEHILEPVGALLGRMGRAALQGWKYFTTVIIPAAREFFHGIFLDHGDVSRGDVILTHMSIDADTLVVAGRGITADVLRLHRRRMTTLVSVLSTTMTILGQSISLILSLLSGPLGWARAVLQVGELVFQILQKQNPGLLAG